MNIFKALSEGNGQITETNITSFFSYLLNKTNDLDSSFFIVLLEHIGNNLNLDIMNHIFKIGNSSIRERAIIFDKKYDFTSLPEFRIKNEQNFKIPDIFIRVSEKKGDTDVAYFLIENKIKKSAKKDLQLSDQYEFFKSSEDFQSNIPVFSVLVTIDDDTFSSMFEQGIQKNPLTVWLRWTNKSDPENSLEYDLKKLLRYDNFGEIVPFDYTSQFIIKSFIDYISTEYAKTTDITNNSFNGFDVIDSAEVTVEGTKFYLKRYENRMIRIFDQDDNPVDNRPVKPLLRKIIQKYDLKIDLNFKTGNLKNTRVLGKEVIEALRANN
jgi:hypothetical protein